MYSLQSAEKNICFDASMGSRDICSGHFAGLFVVAFNWQCFNGQNHNFCHFARQHIFADGSGRYFVFLVAVLALPRRRAFSLGTMGVFGNRQSFFGVLHFFNFGGLAEQSFAGGQDGDRLFCIEPLYRQDSAEKNRHRGIAERRE
jgi:hypothetical protein